MQILRTVLGVIAGYAAIAITLFVVFTGVYFVLGADWSFVEGSWEPSLGWIVMGFVAGLGAAILGGYVTGRIDKTGTGTWALMGLIVVLGIVAILTIPDYDPSAFARTDASPSNLEAMNNAIQLKWVAYVNPVIGCVGVYLSRKCCHKKAADSE